MIDLSARFAKRKIIVGGKIKVLPKTKSRVTLITTEYNFRNTVWFVKKHARPAARRSPPLSKGLQLKTFFSPSFLVAVRLRKNASPKTTTAREIILTGSFRITRNVKISTGYRAAKMPNRILKKFFTNPILNKYRKKINRKHTSALIDHKNLL